MEQAEDAALLEAAPNEEWFWLASKLRPENQSHILKFFRVLGDLDVHALQKSLNLIVRQNAALRTVYERETIAAAKGRKKRILWRKVLKPGDTDVEILDVRQDSSDRKRSLVEERKELEYARRFDLSKGPLFHFTILRTGEQEYFVFLTLHHIVSDGWSANVLLRELGQYYRAFREQAKPGIPAKRAQYIAYVAWRTSTLARNEYLHKTLDYWCSYFTGVPPIELVRDTPYDPERRYRFEYHQRRFAFRAAQGAFNRRYNLRRIALPFAAYALTLSTYARTDTLIISSLVSGRFHPMSNHAIGPFVDVVLMKTRPDPNESVIRLLLEIQQEHVALLTHALVPGYTVLQHLVATNRLPPNYSTDFRVPKIGFAMNFEGARIDPAALLDGVRCDILAVDFRTRAAPHEIFLVVDESDEGIQGELYCLKDFYSSATLTRMTELYQQILERIIEAPETAVAELSTRAQNFRSR